MYLGCILQKIEFLYLLLCGDLKVGSYEGSCQLHN